MAHLADSIRYLLALLSVRLSRFQGSGVEWNGTGHNQTE